jgi:cysteine desulfurase
VGSVTEFDPVNGGGNSPHQSSSHSFVSELPLHPKAREFLLDAFDRGWASPAKIHGPSRQSANLLNEAREIFATHLGLQRQSIHFIAETPLAFHLGISGFFTQSGAKAGSHSGAVLLPKTARSMAYAVAEAGTHQLLPVDGNGYFHLAHTHRTNPNNLLVWQAVNAETGLLGIDPGPFAGEIFVDAVNSSAAIPEWESARWGAAIWDSRAWSGPAGLSIFALSRPENWRNPLPHNDTKPTSGNFSVPLAIASAIALDAYRSGYESHRIQLVEMNKQVRTFIHENFPGSTVAASAETTAPHLLTFTLPGVESQWLVNELDRLGFAVDTGSACMSMNMQPSHVLAAMGLPTTGNVRLRLTPDHSPSDVQALLVAIKQLALPFAD